MAAEDSPDAAGVDPPPPMAPHTAKEFLFAKKTLRRMVLDSQFFPPGADDHRWFRPRPDAGNASAVPEGAALAGPPGPAAASASSPVASDVDGRAASAAFPDDETKCASFLCSVSQGAPLPCSAVENAALAEEMVALAQVSSADAEDEDHATVPAVHEGDIEYGEILGQGGFCEVRLATLKTDRGQNQPPRVYALKYLSLTKHIPDIPQDAGPPSEDQPRPRNKPFERGIADLAIEARFLALLSHENIIGLHHVSGGSLAEQFNCAEGDAFKHRFGLVLLIDPLHETLAKRITDTYVPRVFSCGGTGAPPATPATPSSGSWWKRLGSAKKAASLLPLESWKIQLAQRLEGLKGIAAALRYLHDDCRVIYRDCKPDNIGFYRKPHPNGSGYTEIPQLFDFGLAKELKPKLLKASPNHRPGDVLDTYKLTGRSGSRRYMAPEVAFSAPYNEKVDVFSFGIVLYQVASLVTPFEGYSQYQHEKEVLCNGDRPNVKIPAGKRTLNKIRKSTNLSYEEWTEQHNYEKQTKQLEACTKCVWTKDLKRLTQQCWHDDMRERPSMQEVETRLEGCIQELIPEGLRKSLAQETEVLSLSDR